MGQANPRRRPATMVQMGADGGLVFNITYDSSVSTAPAGFTTAIAAIVNYYTSVFNDPITINIVSDGVKSPDRPWRRVPSAKAKPISPHSAIRKSRRHWRPTPNLAMTTQRSPASPPAIQPTAATSLFRLQTQKP
jgi:hypothetical protein